MAHAFLKQNMYIQRSPLAGDGLFSGDQVHRSADELSKRLCFDQELHPARRINPHMTLSYMRRPEGGFSEEQLRAVLQSELFSDKAAIHADVGELIAIGTGTDYCIAVPLLLRDGALDRLNAQLRQMHASVGIVPQFPELKAHLTLYYFKTREARDAVLKRVLEHDKEMYAHLFERYAFCFGAPELMVKDSPDAGWREFKE